MFKVGDKVSCPLRGCGIVEVIEEKTILDKVQDYLVVKMLNTSMTIMIPTARLDSSPFRLISDHDTLKTALTILEEKEPSSIALLPAKQRIQRNTLKISAGSLNDYAEVVRDLTFAQKAKPLNSGEKSMLMNATKFLADEIALIENRSKEEVTHMLSTLLV